MTPREVLEKLYRQGSFEGEHTEIHPDRIASALSDLSEIVMARQKELYMNYTCCDEINCCGWYNKAITDIAKLFTDKGEKI